MTEFVIIGEVREGGAVEDRPSHPGGPGRARQVIWFNILSNLFYRNSIVLGSAIIVPRIRLQYRREAVINLFNAPLSR